MKDDHTDSESEIDNCSENINSNIIDVDALNLNSDEKSNMNFSSSSMKSNPIDYVPNWRITLQSICSICMNQSVFLLFLYHFTLELINI